MVDASDFLRKNPFPGRAIAETYADDPHRHKTKAKRFLNVLRVCCGRTGFDDDFYDEENEHDHRLFDVSESLGNRPFYWTTALQDSFRQELEKCVVLYAADHSRVFMSFQACDPRLPDVEHRPRSRQLHDQMLRH